jgi:hypothetical protein
MRDRECPIGDCTTTIRFDADVAEVTPRFRLHDLGDVDEFVECPSCEAEVAGYYDDEQPAGATGEADATSEGDATAGADGVEVILDIEDDGAVVEDHEAGDSGDGGEEADAGDSGDGGDEEADAGEEGVGDDDYEPVFTQSTDEFDDPEEVLDAADDDGEA